MQDFDTLRYRVEETAQKLASAQGERQDQTDTLVDILRQLEEKYAAQEQQVSFYRNRVEPLEQANEQLSLLMGNLLDLIDDGFGEDSLAPMRKASEMATALLATDMVPEAEELTEESVPVDDKVDEQPVSEQADMEIDIEPEAEIDLEFEVEVAPEPQPEPEIEAAAESDSEPERQPEVAAEPVPDHEAVSDPKTEEPAVGLSADEILDLVEPGPSQAEFVEETATSDADSQEEDIVGPYSVATDLEMEEEALAKLEEDIDPAAEDVVPPVDAEGIVDTPLMEEVGDQEAVSQEMVALDETAQDDAITIDEIVGDDELPDAVSSADPEETVGFEDVSAATLELEQEEDAASGYDDLPEIVQVAAAAAQASDSEMESSVEAVASDELAAVAEDEALETTAEIGNSAEMVMGDDAAEVAADEAEAIAAIAQAIEEEAEAENGVPPAPADIRSLLLRVEALAKKAEAMRLVQDPPAQPEQATEDDSGDDASEESVAESPKQSGAAA